MHVHHVVLVCLTPWFDKIIDVIGPPFVASMVNPTLISHRIGPDEDGGQYLDDVSHDWLHRNETYTCIERSNNGSWNPEVCQLYIIEMCNNMHLCTHIAISFRAPSNHIYCSRRSRGVKIVSVYGLSEYFSDARIHDDLTNDVCLDLDLDMRHVHYRITPIYIIF